MARAATALCVAALLAATVVCAEHAGGPHVVRFRRLPGLTMGRLGARHGAFPGFSMGPATAPLPLSIREFDPMSSEAGPGHGYMVVSVSSSSSSPPGDVSDMVHFMKHCAAAMGLRDAFPTHGDEAFGLPRLAPATVSLRGSPPVFVRQVSRHHNAAVPQEVLDVLRAAATGALQELASNVHVMRVGPAEDDAPATTADEAGPPDASACAPDVDTLCPHARASLYEMLSCLHGRRSDVSPMCGEVVAQDPTIVGQCYTDISTLCGAVQPGANRIHDCLTHHTAQLSPSCAAYMHTVAGATAVPDAAVHAVAAAAEQGVKPAPRPAQLRMSSVVMPTGHDAEGVGVEAEAEAEAHRSSRRRSHPALAVSVCVGAGLAVVAVAAFFARRASRLRREEQEAAYRALMT